VIVRLREHGVRTLLLDIEGTTTPLAFVHDVLFPYARAHLREYLRDPAAASEHEQPFKLLAAERLDDLARGDAAPAPLADYVEWLMDRDRKSPGLKLLQGYIWQRGYANGELQGQVFPDVARSFERWDRAGVGVAIYSSGSVLAQRLLFGSTPDGDLTRFISSFFDTASGAKNSPDSYRTIAESLRSPVDRLLFVSDVAAELEAAQTAGCHVVMCVRPGNPPQPAVAVRQIHTFEEIMA
jgi:enolase-phosphatase E1